MEKEIPFSKFILAGFLAGILSAAASNIYCWIYKLSFHMDIPVFINPISITMASILPTLVGSIVYYGFTRLSERADLYFAVGSLFFTVLSLGGPLGSTLPDGTAKPLGFVSLTLPMHILAGLACAFVLPWIVSRFER